MLAIKRAAVFATVREKGTGGAPIVESALPECLSHSSLEPRWYNASPVDQKWLTHRRHPQAAGRPSGETAPQLGLPRRAKKCPGELTPCQTRLVVRRGPPGCLLAPAGLPVAGATALAGAALPAAAADPSVEAAGGVRAGVAGGQRDAQRSVPADAA